MDIVWEMPYACTVSRAYEEKVYTGRERKGFFIRWLSKSLSLNPQTEGGLPWDTLTQEVQWKLLDNFYLPIYTGTILHREYQLRESAYSDQELAALLGSRMEEDFEDLEKKGYTFVSADVAMVPSTYTEITDPDAAVKMQKLLDYLEDDDDVQNVWHNWENPNNDEEEE